MKTWDRQPRSPKNFVYTSGRGRAPAALLTLEPASRGLFVVCVRCGVFQIKTFSAPDFRYGPVPTTCCRKFQTANLLFPAAQETVKFSKPKKGNKKFVNPAAQETALVHKIRLHGGRGKGMAESFSR